MRELIDDEIETFASRKGVRAMAVQNFLATMGTDYCTASLNLKLDARDYRWNAATCKAIKDGIQLARKV